MQCRCQRWAGAAGLLAACSCTHAIQPSAATSPARPVAAHSGFFPCQPLAAARMPVPPSVLQPPLQPCPIPPLHPAGAAAVPGAGGAGAGAVPRGGGELRPLRAAGRHPAAPGLVAGIRRGAGVRLPPRGRQQVRWWGACRWQRPQSLPLGCAPAPWLAGVPAAQPRRRRARSGTFSLPTLWCLPWRSGNSFILYFDFGVVVFWQLSKEMEQ